MRAVCAAVAIQLNELFFTWSNLNFYYHVFRLVSDYFQPAQLKSQRLLQYLVLCLIQIQNANPTFMLVLILPQFTWLLR